MDEDLHSLLDRYLAGDCTPGEIDRVNRWYQTIADKQLSLHEVDERAIRDRILTRVQREAGFQSVRPHSHVQWLHPALKVAAALLLILLSAVWLINVQQDSSPAAVLSTASAAGEVVYENKSDSIHRFLLADGSRVALYPSSILRVTQNFADLREVYLSGEGFFDVRKDESRPFLVYAGAVATRVLGTSFFVNAPPETPNVAVRVVSGKVEVFQVDDGGEETVATRDQRRGGNGVVLSPNEKVEYFADGGHLVTGLVERPVPVRAIDQEQFSFIYENKDVTRILSDVQKRFGIEIITENNNIGTCRFTGDISALSLYDLLDVLCNSIGAAYEVKGTRILITGEGCQ